MGNLEKRIDQLEAAVEQPTASSVNELLIERMTAARPNSNSEANAVNYIRWAFMCGPELTRRSIELLEAVELTERLLGKEIADHLRNGADGREHAIVSDQDNGDSLCSLAYGAVRGNVCRWMLEHKDEWTGDPSILLERLRAFDRDEDALSTWRGDEYFSDTP